MSDQKSNHQKIITIDGGAGTGKSTAADAAATKLDFARINSGNIYRGFTLLVEGFHGSMDDLGRLTEIIRDEGYRLTLGHDGSVLLNGMSLSHEELHCGRINDLVQHVAQVPVVRQRTHELQHSLLESGRGIVVEGRDIGTKVFPNARLKLFFIADDDTKAERQWLEQKDKPNAKSLEEVKASILARDKRDTERSVSPMKPADDAIIIDTTHLSREEVVEMVVDLWRQINVPQQQAV